MKKRIIASVFSFLMLKVLEDFNKPGWYKK